MYRVYSCRRHIRLVISVGFLQEGALAQGFMTYYIPQMLQPDWSKLPDTV